MRSALVLAGGYSTRFGDADKAISELDGDPLIRRVVERVEPATGEVIVNCRDEQRERIATALEGVDYRTAVDPVPDRGPVAGIRTGCRVARGRWTFVTACDMPFVEAALASDLFEAAGDGDAEGAVPRIDGRLRPLAAVYRTDSAIEAADTTLGLGSGAMTTMLDRLSFATVSDPVPPRSVRDVDSREDLRVVGTESD